MWCGGASSHVADVHVEEARGQQVDRGASGVQSCAGDIIVEKVVGIGVEVQGREGVGFPTFLVFGEGRDAWKVRKSMAPNGVGS